MCGHGWGNDRGVEKKKSRRRKSGQRLVRPVAPQSQDGHDPCPPTIFNQRRGRASAMLSSPVTVLHSSSPKPRGTLQRCRQDGKRFSHLGHVPETTANSPCMPGSCPSMARQYSSLERKAVEEADRETETGQET